MALDWKIERDLEPYIATHLAYELKYLLVAATTWDATRDEASRHRWPDHLVVIAMESAFVHARTLNEFLTLEEGWAKGPRSPHDAPDLPLWGAYSEAVHMKVLHPDPRRPYEPGEQLGDDLNERVRDLAQESLSGWAETARQPAMADFREAMEVARRTAVAEAAHAAGRMNRPSCFK